MSKYPVSKFWTSKQTTHLMYWIDMPSIYNLGSISRKNIHWNIRYNLENVTSWQIQTSLPIFTEIFENKLKRIKDDRLKEVLPNVNLRLKMSKIPAYNSGIFVNKLLPKILALRNSE